MHRLVDIEVDPDFTIHTSYHNDFFLLRTRVLVNGENAEVRSIKKGKYEEPALKYCHSTSTCSTNLLSISTIVSPILQQYGACHVDTFYYQLAPLFHVTFGSETCLKNFLLKVGDFKHSMEVELLSMLSEDMKRAHMKTTELLAVEVQPDLFLIFPNQQETKGAEVHLVTAENCSRLVTQWKDRKLFHLGTLYQDGAEPPQVTSHPVSQKDVLPGKPVTFSVRATGTQPLSYRWEWKPAEEESESAKWQSCETYWSTLTIPVVKKFDEGSYRCVISNYTGNVTSQPAELRVAMEVRLTVDDLQTITQELLPVAERWKAIGVALSLNFDEDVMKTFPKHVAHRSVEDHLSEMLKWWLSCVSPEPSWRTIIDALHSPAVGESKLAQNLESKYCVATPLEPGDSESGEPLNLFPVSGQLLEEGWGRTTMEYKALHEHFDKIVNIISSSLEPHSLADRLYSARLIDESAVEEASETGVEKMVRIERLVSAVRTQVEKDPSNYYHFVSLTEDLPGALNLLKVTITLLPSVAFAEPILTKTFGSSGGIFEIKKASVTIRIPPGAISSDAIATVSIKICSEGPFQFPKDCKVVSSVCLLETNVKLVKPVEIVAGHFDQLLSKRVLTSSLVPDYRAPAPFYLFREVACDGFETETIGKFPVPQLGVFAAVGQILETAQTTVAKEDRPKISELATVPIEQAWYTLGLQLGLEEEVLNSIEVNQSNKLVKCKRAMFRKWLESFPTASWNDLIKALLQIGEEETAEKVRKEFSPSQPSGSVHHPDDGNHGDDHHSNNSEGPAEDEVDHGISDMDADLPPEGETTVGMLLAGDNSPGSSGRKLTSTSSDSQSLGTSKTSKISRDDETSLPRQQAVPTRSSPVGEATSFEEDTSTSMRAQAQQDDKKAQVHSAPLGTPTFEEQHASSVKVQSIHQQDESPPSTGEQKSVQSLEGRVKTAPIATVTPLESPLFSSSSQVKSQKHNLRETVAALQLKTRVEPDSPLHGTETKTESSRGISESRLTSSSSEIFHSFSGDEGVEPVPALSSPFVSSELTMPYSSEWKHISHMSPLTANLTTVVSGGGGNSGLDQNISPRGSSSVSSTSIKTELLNAVLSGDVLHTDSILRSARVGVDEQLKDGRTALMLAAIGGRSEMVKLLLHRHKATVDEKDSDGRTALHLAASYGNYEIVKILVSACANVDTTSIKDGTPVLLYPASKGYSMVTEYLLENGANANVTDKLGVTPLIAATRKGQRDVVAVLLQHGADVSPVSLDTSRSALQEAIERGYTGITTMLMKATAEASERSRGLFKCTTAEVVQKLVKKGAKVDERRGDGTTPLMVHAEQGSKEVVRELIRQSANVDLQDEHGLSALMKASRVGDVEVTRLLVAGRAILDLKSKKGFTALMYAIQNEHVRVVKELLLAGADATARDRNGRSVMDMAKEKENQEIIGLLNRQKAVSNPNDPFVQLLSGYLQQKMVTSRGAEGPDLKRREPTPPKRREAAVPVPVHAAPKPTTTVDEDSTMRDQLSKAWKRIADLETRIHDLTLQATMELPEVSDLTYLERGRLEEEYRKLKELKKKAEYYAVEAKQTAQRLSAENFKLKEDLSRERHHNELTRKNMIREMEQKMDKSATALDRADARLEVFEQEVTARALQLIRRMPAPAMASRLSREEFQPEQIKEFILTQTVRANIALVGVAGLPYSGKSTLLHSILDLRSTSQVHGGLDAFEAVVMKDKLNDLCYWGAAKLEEAEVTVIAAALAQLCAKSQTYPSFEVTTGSQSSKRPSESVSSFNDDTIAQCFDECFVGVKKLMVDLETRGEQHKLVTASLTLLNFWDIGVNRSVIELVGKLAGNFRHLMLLNVLSLQKDCDDLYKPPRLGDRYYQNRYSSRGDDKRLMVLLSSLHYLVRCVCVTSCEPETTILVGTRADRFSEQECNERKVKILQSVRARAEELGVSRAVCPQMLAVDARNRKAVLKEVRALLEKAIEKDHRFEKEIPLSWIFLRSVLHKTNRMFMSRKELVGIANKCGLQTVTEIEKFLKLFVACGSLLYCSNEDCPELHNCVILQPVAFIQALDQLYYIEYDKNIPTELMNHVDSTKHGYVSEQLVKHLWPRDHHLFLQILIKLGMMVEISDILHRQCPGSSPCYFMPTLRPLYYSQLPAPDSESLIIATSNLPIIPYDVQSQFVIEMQIACKKDIEFMPTRHFNTLHFKWNKQSQTSTDKISADIFIRFLGEIAEIEVKINSKHISYLGTVCSIVKTICMDIFQRLAKQSPEIKYQFGFVCPNSTATQPHYLYFHVQRGIQTLHCTKCGEQKVASPQKRVWMQAGVESALSHFHHPEDSVTHADIAAIAENLSHLTPDKRLELARHLNFTNSEVKAKAVYCPPDELLLILLLEWRRRYPIANKRLLAKALANCGQYAEATKLDAALVVNTKAHRHSLSAEPAEPLTNKHLGAISQIITDWKELGVQLQISSDDLDHISRTHRSNSERCSKMLLHWFANVESRSEPRQLLSETLLNLGYTRLAEFLTTEADPDLFM